jgi:hypothetical protein
MSASVRLNRRGATLPLVIIVLALMAVAVAISYGRISAERVLSTDGGAQQGAFLVAQSGLSRFLSNMNGGVKPALLVGQTQTANYNDLPGGTARVDMMMVRESTSTLLPAVYVITSRGLYTAAKRWNSRSPSAERTVATYALWTPAPLDVDAAITSLNGITKTGTSGMLSGVDRCGASPTIAGVAVPTGTGVNGTMYTGPATPIDGNPDNLPVPLGSPGPAGGAVQEVDIDWAAIVAGTYLPPAYTWPAWPPAGSPGMNDWPIIRVNNNGGAQWDLPADGKGILIVTGDFEVSGSAHWDGLILVGGKFTSNGNNDVFGGVITGLNIKLGQAVPPSDVAHGNKTYQYDSCALSRALAKIGSIQRLRNAWTDTWSSY